VAVVVAGVVAAAVVVAAVAPAGCLFLPDIADDGYDACANDADCGPGRVCADNVKLCAPPPWHDDEFTERRLIVVENPSDVELPVGAAVPLRIGGPDGALTLDDVEADARFADFDDAQWRVVGVYRDLFRDRFDVWVPLSRALPPGARDALAWMEHRTKEGGVRVVEEPSSAFALFDDCDDFPVDGDERRFVDAPGAAAPVPGDGTVDVVDNVKVVWVSDVVSPASVTFRARVNGLTCDEVFLGFTAQPSGSFSPPSAGFFIDQDLQASAEVFADPNQPAWPAGPVRSYSEVPGDEHRFTVDVDGSRVRLSVDDVVFEEIIDIDPAFGDTPLMPTVQVGGSCSVTVDAVWVTPLSFDRPKVVAEAPVQLNITY
jgi:hypothetical protein